jgi:hypothetical protein
MIVVKGGVEGLVVPPEEEEAGTAAAALCEEVNAFDNVIWHGKSRPAVTIQTAAGGEAVEVVSALGIPGGSEGEGAGRPSAHSVVRGFVYLDVRAKLYLAMSVVVNTESEHNLARAESFRDTVSGRKGIEPKNARVDHFDDNACRETLKR